MPAYVSSHAESSFIPSKAELLTLDVPNFMISEIWQYVFEYAAPMKPVITQINAATQRSSCLYISLYIYFSIPPSSHVFFFFFFLFPFFVFLPSL